MQIFKPLSLIGSSFRVQRCSVGVHNWGIFIRLISVILWQGRDESVHEHGQSDGFRSKADMP